MGTVKIKAAHGRDAAPQIDPLRRIYIPIEKRNVNGDWTFQTRDGQCYVRDGHTGSIRRMR